MTALDSAAAAQGLPTSGGEGEATSLAGLNLHPRIAARLAIQPDGCWLWTGATDRGYGKANLGGINIRVHRYVFMVANGPTAEGLVLDHLCRNRACVNPIHLQAVEQGENVRRGLAPLVNAMRPYVLVNECYRGHAYDQVNTYVSPNGRRYCRACKAVRSRGYRQAVPA